MISIWSLIFSTVAAITTVFAVAAMFKGHIKIVNNWFASGFTWIFWICLLVTLFAFPAVRAGYKITFNPLDFLVATLIYVAVFYKGLDWIKKGRRTGSFKLD